MRLETRTFWLSKTGNKSAQHNREDNWYKKRHTKLAKSNWSAIKHIEYLWINLQWHNPSSRHKLNMVSSCPLFLSTRLTRPISNRWFPLQKLALSSACFLLTMRFYFLHHRCMLCLLCELNGLGYLVYFLFWSCCRFLLAGAWKTWRPRQLTSRRGYQARGRSRFLSASPQHIWGSTNWTVLIKLRNITIVVINL